MNNLFERFSEQDAELFEHLEKFSLTGGNTPVELPLPPEARERVVRVPDENYSFLHEAAIYGFHGKLFAAWYACPKTELCAEAAILFRISADGGESWGEEKLLITDKTGKLLYCPPVFGEENGKLYMLVNEMVSADHMHALDWFIYDEKTENFKLVKTLPLPFKLNTNVVTLENGNLFLPGRIAALDAFPVTPAAMISENGVTGDWTVYKMQEDGSLFGGASLVHPECTTIEKDGELFTFCRDDQRRVPLGYRSSDGGKSWSGPYAIDLPFIASKIYAGRLSDGRYYAVGNTPQAADTGWGNDRTKLVLYVSEQNEWIFRKGYVLFDGVSENNPQAHAWHYPACCEFGGALHIVYSVNYGHQSESRRGGAVISIPLEKL